MVVIPEADADGAAGSGLDSCHGVEVDQHICYSLQDELFVHYGLTISMDTTRALQSSVISNLRNYFYLSTIPHCCLGNSLDFALKLWLTTSCVGRLSDRDRTDVGSHLGMTPMWCSFPDRFKASWGLRLKLTSQWEGFLVSKYTTVKQISNNTVHCTKLIAVIWENGDIPDRARNTRSQIITTQTPTVHCNHPSQFTVQLASSILSCAHTVLMCNGRFITNISTCLIVWLLAFVLLVFHCVAQGHQPYN